MPLFDNSLSCCKDQDVESLYDRANRVVRTEHYAAGGVTPDETREFTYDNVGNVLTLSDIAGDTVYVYDELYRVVTETRTNTGENAYLVASAYDLRGNRRSVLYNAARELKRVYDAVTRLLTVTDSVGDKVTTYDYDHNGNRESCEYPNGVLGVPGTQHLSSYLSG